MTNHNTKRGYSRKYNTPPLLLCDFYKTVHSEQYPHGITRVVSNFTPRMTRIKDQDSLVMFGLQGFIKEYLIDYFEDNFFRKSEDVVVAEYERILTHTLSKQNFNPQKIRDLHQLGYLPLDIWGLPEGVKVPIKTPMFMITNSHEDFAWLVNSIETLISTSLWHGMISANVGAKYREIVNKWFDKTDEDNISRNRALGDFSMRGQESLESATRSSAGWLLSFLPTATIPAISYMENYYNVDVEEDEVGFGMPSTEHSVMCSNFAVDGDEITMIKRLLTDIYPHSSFTAVLDTYDYWNVVNNLLPQCREEIEAHDGVFGVRGDSGDPVEIVTDTVFALWEHFGGTINSKGYKVLNPKIKAVYGDGITLNRAEKIYEILESKGFASSNVLLGVGSFSMQALQENDGTLQPFTRDTFGIAIKATYAELGEDKPLMLFKNPKTDTGHFKKSQKGCCLVTKNDKGEIIYEDGLTWPELKDKLEDSAYVQYFKDDHIITEQSLTEIRDRLHNGKF